MNEFLAKKLGEVLAFANVGNDTIDRANDVFINLFKERTDEFKKINSEHIQKIKDFVEGSDFYEITLKKSEATGEKLKKMRDMYIGDEWDNPAEILEWLGFFEGAAFIHWQLVIGGSEKTANEDLRAFAEKSAGFHHDLIHAVAELIKDTGRKKS